jgi:glyoxylase-like metal-dependent hydrolase (beta-lactamase superfamily II)
VSIRSRADALPSLAGVVLLATACAAHPASLPATAAPPQSLSVNTGGPARSTIYLERVNSGVIVIDLGWTGAKETLVEALGRIGAAPADVVGVFITHSHRDHISAWPVVRAAPFHLSAAEVPLLFGEAEHEGWIPKAADKLNAPDLPKRGEIDVLPFAQDTAFVFGADTLRAFIVPGHTAGSSVYLFRRTLFAGDAVAKIYFGPYVAALPGYSDDRDEARRSLVSLRERLRAFAVARICTAHAACREVNDEFWRELLGTP